MSGGIYFLGVGRGGGKGIKFGLVGLSGQSRELTPAFHTQ